MSEAVEFTLLIPGPARAKERPRFNTRTGRAYTPARTAVAENDVRAVWREAGCPRIPDREPIAVVIDATIDRPRTHYLGSGKLSAAGRRSVYPVRKPDADNLAKLALDALNGFGFEDDSQVVDLVIHRRWATWDLPARTVVSVHVMTEELRAPGTAGGEG